MATSSERQAKSRAETITLEKTIGVGGGRISGWRGRRRGGRDKVRRKFFYVCGVSAAPVPCLAVAKSQTLKYNGCAEPQNENF
jgi:hypothetical protein